MSRLLCLLTTVVRVLCSGANVRPNIVIIIADDLGWNDVGFHGSNQIPTPNIDALAYSGLILQNYYVTPICTPSRAALMTGKHPIHTGMQHRVIYGTEPRGLPLSEKLLPQYLKELGYKTHLVGKWHLGHYKREYLPLNRGFDSHVGFWTGKIDMYDHINMDQNQWGHDFRRGFEVAYDLVGKYATDIYTDEAVKVIDAHNITDPLFLMVAHSAVHSGNGYEPIRAPDKIIANFSHINHYPRQKFAGVLTKLDESVGKVVAALQKKSLLENSIIMFSTDNGGPANGFNENAASNYPLRGVKNTLWEGGVRGAGLLWSPLLENRSRVATQRTHIVDWLPTLYAAAGGNANVFQGIDGVNLWEALSKDLKSQRISHINNIDPILKIASITVDQWKILEGTNYNGQWDKWYGPGGREGRYDAERVLAAAAARALRSLALLPDERHMLRLRESATVVCEGAAGAAGAACDPLRAPCLFDVERDPCERNNLADSEPEVLQRLLAELEKVKKTMIPPNNKPRDPSGDPKYWGRVYTNFGDYEAPHASTICT